MGRSLDSPAYVLCFAVLVIRLAGREVAAGFTAPRLGCKFAQTLCYFDQVCFDDRLFGQCISPSADLNDVYPLRLTARQRYILERYMAGMVELQYFWEDELTQCVIGSLLEQFAAGAEEVDVLHCTAEAETDTRQVTMKREPETLAFAPPTEEWARHDIRKYLRELAHERDARPWTQPKGSLIIEQSRNMERGDLRKLAQFYNKAMLRRQQIAQLRVDMEQLRHMSLQPMPVPMRNRPLLGPPLDQRERENYDVNEVNGQDSTEDDITSLPPNYGADVAAGDLTNYSPDLDATADVEVNNKPEKQEQGSNSTMALGVDPFIKEQGDVRSVLESLERNMADVALPDIEFQEYDKETIYMKMPTAAVALFLDSLTDDVANKILMQTGFQIRSAIEVDTTPVAAAVFARKNHSEPTKDKGSMMAMIFIVTTVLFCLLLIIAVYVVNRYLLRRHHFKETLSGVKDWLGEKSEKAREDYESLVRSQSPKTSDSDSGTMEPISQRLDISTAHLILSYMEDNIRDKDRIDREWAALCQYEPDNSGTTIAQQHPDENRYFPTKLPYDASLVKLSTGGYVNASNILDVQPRQPVYIAAEHPLANTAANFWAAVWESNASAIVCLSQPQEDLFVYWPIQGSQSFGDFEVHLVSEHPQCDDYLLRSLLLRHKISGQTRTITQFHFLTWPEHATPANIRNFLDFRRKVNRSYRGKKCPLVVHCSDGCGRTGTFCLLDMVWSRLRSGGAKEISPGASAEHLREQRHAMVATRQQYEFVLICIAEEVQQILATYKTP